ncbi:lipopolysaccharide biosynthesis protein [Halobacteriovorax sp.]|uniref:lipopolysaccharide biosynthesis protein n=1 Tax=Halobacteriovorax sp. TaxID=2020862 RepID=UPI003AF28BA5
MKLFVPNVDNSVFILLMLIRGGDLLSDLAYTVKQRQKDIRYIGVSLSLKSLFIIIICLVANIQANMAIDHFLIGILLITTIFFAIDLKTSIRSFSFKTDYIKRITILTTPLALASLVNSVNANIPRYLLDFYYDKTSVAIFSTFFFFYSSIIIITNSFIQVSLNKLSLSLNSQVETRKMIKSYIIFAFMTSLSFILFNELIGQFIYNLIFGTKYTEYAHYLHYLNIIIPQAIAIIMINYFVIALRSYKTSFLFTSLTLIVHFAVAMVLIKGSEIEGSFDAFIIAQAFYIIINIVFITKKVRELRHEF